MEIAAHTSSTAAHGSVIALRNSRGLERAVPVVTDQVEISATGRQQSAQGTTAPAETAGEANTPAAAESPDDLDVTAQRALQALRQRDQEVRQHEQAHLQAAGQFATGGPRYTYETGPDGQRYAVGGEVPIDLSAIAGDPAATIQKAQTIRRAALAPANPSGPDLAVAAQATALAAEARQELSQLQSTRTARAAGTAGAVAQASEPGAAGTLAPHVCGPNCQEHDTRAGAEAPPGVSGNAAVTGILPSRAVASYQLASRTP